MKRPVVALVLLLMLTAVACSSDDTSSDGTTTGPTTSDETTSGGATDCTDPVEAAAIDIKDFAFSPNCITTPAGTDTLAITNSDTTDHTFTILAADLNEAIDPGSDVAVDISALNDQRWEFRCNIHPTMTGVLIVT
jgi:plastocyanin